MQNDFKKGRYVESSDHNFSLALEVFLEHDLSLHTRDSLVQEVVDGRDVLVLMSSVFATGQDE